LAGPISPGEIVALYGSGLGPSSLVRGALNAAGVLGTTLAGTRVLFNGAAAPVLYTSSNQVAAIVPYGTTGSRAQVSVQYQGQVSAAMAVDIAAAAPALFTLSGAGNGAVLAINQNGSINDSAHPAPAGSFVTLYATGEGQTNPPGNDGVPAAIPLPIPVVPVTVTIGGQRAVVQYAGGAPGLVAGLMQVNVQIPNGIPSGEAAIVLRSADTASQPGVTIYVSN
jgi:uncharacterized protein (TIGR03437 family)